VPLSGADDNDDDDENEDDDVDDSAWKDTERGGGEREIRKKGVILEEVDWFFLVPGKREGEFVCEIPGFLAFSLSLSFCFSLCMEDFLYK